MIILAPDFTGEEEFSVYLKEIEDKLYSLSVKKALSYRSQFLGENHINPFMIDRERTDLLLRPELYETLMVWKSKSKDKLLRRKVDLLSREILKAKVAYEPEIFRLTNKINKKIQSFIPQLNGTDMTRNELDDIIRKSPDRNLREKAWWAEISFGEQIEREVIALIKLRNQKARELGYNHYGEMCLILEDINQDKLFLLFRDILKHTDNIWKNTINNCKEALSIDTVYPWDIKYYEYKYLNAISDNYFPKDEIIENFRKFLEHFNMDLNKLPIQVNYQDIPHGGICIVIEIGKDVRVLTNPGDGHRWYKIMFHELGHALHASLISSESYIISSGDPDFFWEGMACVIQQITSEREWLRDHFDLPEKVIKEFILQERTKSYHWYRKIISDFFFEVSLYQRNEGDLNRRFREYAYDNLFIEIPTGIIWPHDSIYITHPFYIQNYLLADIIAYHIIHYYKEKYTSIFHRDFLNYLKTNYFEQGAMIRWDKKIKIGTGKELSADSLLKELSPAIKK